MRRGGLALIAILVLGSLTKLLVPGGSSTPPGVENKGSGVLSNTAPQVQESDLDVARKSVDWYPAQLREKIRDYFGVEHGPELDSYEGKVKQTADPKAKGIGDIEHVCDSLENWCVPHGRASEIQFVIATAPDPVHTHLGLFFDRDIDAIQQGATNQNYLFDRAIMPWQYSIEPANQETDEDKLLREVRESYPGLMIFRGAAAQTTLFIFVVGETPTSGINKEQFHRAVEIIHEIREGRDYVGADEALDFGVLGPVFSGSLFSLHEILERYIQDLPKNSTSQNRVIPVFSTVMGTDAIKSFDVDEIKRQQVRMAVFMIDGQTALDAFLDHVCSLGYSARDVVVLNEDDTQYGTSVSPSTQPGPCHNGVSAIPFPRGISQFRSAYSKDLQIQSQATDSNQTQRRNLRLDLEVTGSDDDNVAPYATAQTALSQEAIMLAIVSELRRDEARFIMVRATDPLDELFLARYLGSQYPDARLVVPTPDLLFAREEGGLVDGTLGLNIYPVWPAYLNPLCSTGTQIFPASSSAGLYNATVALLSGPIKEGQLPEKTKAPRDSAAPLSPCTLSPNLWLTIVSRNSVYPIQVLPSKGSLFFPISNKSRREENAKRSGRIQSPWAILCILSLVLLANHVRCNWKPITLGYWQTAKQLPDPGLSSRGKSWILWLGAVSLVGMPVVFVSSLTPLPVGRGDLGTYIAAIVVWTFLIGFTLFVTVDFLLVRKEQTLAWLFLFMAGCFTWAGVVYARESSAQMVLWQQRAVDLASHISPVTPLLLLLAAFYAWFWFSLKSETLTDWRSPQLPNSKDLPETYEGLSEPVAEGIRKVIRTFGPPRGALWGAISLVLVLGLRGCMTGPGKVPIRSLEGTWFDILYTILFGFAILLLTATLFRVAAVWWKLQPMLMALGRPGMTQALQRLKGFEWDVIWNPLESMRDEARRLYLKEIHVVERLQESLGDAADTTHPGAVELLKKECGEILAIRGRIYGLLAAGIPVGSKNAEEFIGAFRNMQEKLAKMAGFLCKDFLDRSWKALPADDGIEASLAQPQDSSGTMTVKAAITSAGDSQRNTIVNAEIKRADDPWPSGLSAKPLQLAEEFVACVYSTFITIVLLRIRWLVFSSVVIYTAVVFSSTSYPFQPVASLRNLALLLFLLGVIVVGYVYEEMHRDPTVRCMTSTDPNKVDAAFWLKLVSAGLLPLLGLLTSLFPQVGHFLYTIAAPILQATR